MFADDTAIFSASANYQEAVANLQKSISKVLLWSQQWRVKVNNSKSKYIVFTLRSYSYLPIKIGSQIIPKVDSVLYLGMTLDHKLNWKEHIRLKKLQVKDKLRKLHWLIGSQSQMSLDTKRTAYLLLVKPIWTYGLAVWGSASDTNLLTIERCENVALRTIVKAYRYERNVDIRRDLNMPTIREEIRRFSARHLSRLQIHLNPTAAALPDTVGETRRLKRIKIEDLASRY